MDWKVKLYRTISNYILRDIKPMYKPMFIDWWHVASEEILNEFEFMRDEFGEEERKEELLDLKWIIESDANIDNEDDNVKRILNHVNTFINELNQEVEYEAQDQIGPDNPGME